jgi:hypothetical protein
MLLVRRAGSTAEFVSDNGGVAGAVWMVGSDGQA